MTAKTQAVILIHDGDKASGSDALLNLFFDRLIQVIEDDERAIAGGL